MSDYEVKVQKYKTDSVENLKNYFQQGKDYIFTNYRGLSVEKIYELRSKLYEQQALYKVVKNRFAKIALKELDKPTVDIQLTGPTAIALAKEDSGGMAKVLVEFAKEGIIDIKGGIIDGAIFNAAQVEAFSKLPTKDELIAKLMGTMKAPVQNMVYVLNGVPQKLVRTLQAVADQKQG